MVPVMDILKALDEAVGEFLPGSEGHINLVREGFKRPAYLVELEKLTMDDLTARLVDRSATARITVFEPVDEYHDSQVDDHARKICALMALFSGRTLQVGDRYLDIGKCTADYYSSYAEMTCVLSWQDDRELNEPEYEPIRHVDVTMEVNKDR